MQVQNQMMKIVKNIPGPACGDQDQSGTPTTIGAVYISNGVFGNVGGVDTDLDASVYDWRNPVADVSVSR